MRLIRLFAPASSRAAVVWGAPARDGNLHVLPPAIPHKQPG